MNLPRRLRRLAFATSTTLLLTAAIAASPAQAASVRVDHRDDELSYQGGSENNHVSISGSGSTYTITDSGAIVNPGSGCNVSGGKIVCSSSQIDRITVRTNGGDDSVVVSSGTRASLYGGTGNDRLVGGSSWDSLSGESGDDSLDGGAGGDTLYGGDGFDTADYSARMAPVNVKLTSSYWFGDDGESNEHDNVGTSVEMVLGGSGNDSLTGNSSKNTLKGGAGDDKLYGTSGDDTLDGGIGNDTFDGGDGNDVLRARDGSVDQLVCGTGTDSGEADSIDNVGADCDAVAVPAGGVATPGAGPVKTTLDLIPWRVRLTRRGQLRLRIACPQSLGTCEGTVVITPRGNAAAAASKRKSNVIGRGKYKLRGGETKVVSVKLSRNGRRRVLRRKRLRCRASSTTRAANGRTTVKKNITLQAPRRKK